MFQRFYFNLILIIHPKFAKILLNDDSASEICQNTETDGAHSINVHSREILANEYQVKILT